MVIVGLLMIAAGFMGTSRWLYVLIGGSAVLVVSVLGYSYVLWRAEQKNG
jgi:hypothetical protein